MTALLNALRERRSFMRGLSLGLMLTARASSGFGGNPTSTNLTDESANNLTDESGNAITSSGA